MVASVYAFVVGAFIYRELPLREVPKILINSAISSAAILALVGFANVFGWILVAEHIPQAIARAVLSVTDNKYLVILLINILLLFVGMFMETIGGADHPLRAAAHTGSTGRRRAAAFRHLRRAQPDDRAYDPASRRVSFRLRQHARVLPADAGGKGDRALLADQYPGAASGSPSVPQIATWLPTTLLH